MPWTHPGTGQEFNTIPEQIQQARGGVPVFKQVIAVLVCLGLGVNAYLIIFVKGVHGLGNVLWAGFCGLMGIFGFPYILTLLMGGRT